MMYILHLIFIITPLLTREVLSEDWIECPSENITVENDNKNWINYNTNINISYDRNNLAIYEYYGVQNVNILLNDTMISFSAYDILENENTIADDIIFENLNATVTGTARVLTLYNVGDTLTDCDFYLVKNDDEEGDRSSLLQTEIMNKAASCLRSELCKKLGTLKLEDRSNALTYGYDFGPLSVIEDGREACLMTTNDLIQRESYVKEHETQKTINNLIDLVLIKLAKTMKEMNEGKVQVSNMNNTFSFFGAAELYAENGTFEDITVFARKGDVALSHEGVTFSVSCSFALPEGYIKYNKYEINHSFFGLYEGELSATVRNVVLTAKVSADYDEKPCRAVLQDLRVSEFGGIDVSLTGLGALSGMVSGLVSWSMSFFQGEIVHTLETKFKKFAMNKLSQYDCETLH